MKILHVISSTNPSNGGPIEGIKQLQIPLKALGIEVTVACSDAPDSPWLTTSDLPHVVALGPSYGKYSYAPKLVPWLRQNAPEYSAVIVNGIWQYHSVAVRRALRGLKVPYYVFTHGMLDPWFKNRYPLKHLKKWLYWPWAEYRVLRDARAVVFTCEDERFLARQSFWLYRVNEEVTSYGTANPPSNGQELAQKFIDAYKQVRGKRVVLFLSRIHEKKGCDLLLEAFARVHEQDTRLHLVMAGPDRDGYANTLKSLAKSLGIDNRVTWTGMLQGDMKWGAFFAAEVFCLPSHQENFGIVVAEALACGKPVLISDKVNIWREIVEDGAGFVSDDTATGALHNLKCWLAMNSTEYHEMSLRSVKCFMRHFQVDRAAARLSEIISVDVK